MLALARTAARIIEMAFEGLCKAPVNAGNSASELLNSQNLPDFWPSLVVL